MVDSDAALVVAIALAAGVSVQILARVSRIPAIILLLAAGALLGPDVAGWVDPSALGDGLFILVDFAVAIILFEGALNLNLARLRREERIIRRLVTTGALVTLAGASLAAYLWLGWPWEVATLFGSLVVVTGPTVVGPLVRSLRLLPRLQTVLEAEGVFIDPIGALLAVLVLQVVIATNAFEAAAGMPALIMRLVLGLGLGVAGGFLLGYLLRARRLVHGLDNVLVLAFVTLVFHIGEHAVSQSGLIAVTLAGVIVGNFRIPLIDDLREFKDQITLLLIGTIFVLLAADIRLADVRALGASGLAVVATLILVVRPLSVWLATWNAKAPPRDTVFIAALAPRGIVAAAIASLVAESLDVAGIPGGTELRAMVFLAIAGTVVASGTLAWPLATLLRLRLPARDRVAILGAQGLGLALASRLRARGVTVVLIDSDPQRCSAAQQDGFTVVYGDGLKDRTLLRARIQLVGTVVGVTFNENLNSQFVRFARDEFDVPRGLVSTGLTPGEEIPAHVARHGSHVLFDGPHDQERWDVRWRQGEVVIEPFVYEPPATPAETEAPEVDERSVKGRSDTYVILTLESGSRTTAMARSAVLKPGQRAAVAIHRPAAERALTQLAVRGWRPAIEKDVPRS